ncbi:hypothetical protein JTE90_029576 [Oedothorax gibbosus]|uniref:Uncharacterized protein n=1 Tax=Oedothorax gibbosus TaxID=931172 RepID=A0AAV6VB37_9ARAC|nr:hypothetical protein JTE90_029576 [Oedothorax gibbosus]
MKCVAGRRLYRVLYDHTIPPSTPPTNQATFQEPPLICLRFLLFRESPRRHLFDHDREKHTRKSSRDWKRALRGLWSVHVTGQTGERPVDQAPVDSCKATGTPSTRSRLFEKENQPFMRRPPLQSPILLQFVPFIDEPLI